MRHEHEIVVRRLVWAFLGAAVVAIGIGAFFGIYGVRYIPTDTPDHMVLLANFLSGTMGLFWTFATVLMLIAAFCSQQLQLHDQQMALEETNKRIDAETQRASREAFERTFFELIRLHHEICRATTLRKSAVQPINVDGRECFDYIYAAFSDDKFFLAYFKMIPYSAAERYEHLFQVYKPQLAHYFRNLFHIFLFVDRSNIQDRTQYTKIACAQLSNSELLLFFYNGISVYGKKRFKGLIEKYGLLQNLDTDELLAQQDINLYLPSARENK